MTIQMIATEQYFPVVLYKVVLTLSDDDILKCDYSNEVYTISLLNLGKCWHETDHSNTSCCRVGSRAWVRVSCFKLFSLVLHYFKLFLSNLILS